ncbi:hypothetical protein QR680_000208 [Steinernema hermaphroditum]|uniref:Uncharacterized protein n=1 Tax=Steinernema hermaphroditum TaxID=289476 RepID=A0AA39GVU9_9BILA|nr:hypothetical protein QR680_000208 [Steinernema hermaphroditum]
MTADSSEKKDILEVDRVEKKRDSEDEQSEDPPTVSFLAMYRYATKFDYLLLTVGVLFGATQGAFNAVSTVIFRHLTDALIRGEQQWNNGTFDYEEFYDGAMTAIYMYLYYGAGVFTLGFLSMSSWHTLCERQIHLIRNRYFAAVLRQNMGWFDKHESGTLTTQMSDGIDRIKDGIGDKMGVIITCMSNFIAGLVIAFVLSWRMTLVMLCFVPFMAGSMIGIGKVAGHMIKKELKEYGKAGAVAEEVIGGIRTVIAFNGQLGEIERYKKYLLKAVKSGTIKAVTVSGATALIQLFLFVSMGVAFWYGTTLVMKGDISPGTTFAVFWAVMGGTFALGQAAPQLAVIIGAKAAAATIFEVIDREPEIDSLDPKGRTLDKTQGTIEFKDVHFRYPTRPDVKILNGVSYRIEPGQSIALVGHSGCGKSTMIGLLLRYYEQESGSVTIDGVPVKDFNIQWLRNTVGVVSQEPVLFAATIAENLCLGKEGMSMADMVRVCQMANAHQFIMKLPEGYKTRIGEGGVQLSGGQKQRIAIARALARDPKILLLDEATSALDTESEHLVQVALDKASDGRTTISIAHRLSTIRNCDKIFVFDHGNIVECGSHDFLMKKGGVYRELVRAQEIEKAKDEGEEDNFPDMVPEMEKQRFNRERSRRSRRMTRSLTHTSNQVEEDCEELEEESEKEKVDPSGIWEIIKFARQEWVMLIVALIGAIIRGLTFPIFSIIYGQMFKTLTETSHKSELHGAVENAFYFAALGVSAGASTLVSGFLFGRAGETLTCRLRLKLFENIIKQDGEYFDSLDHSSGKLTTRLATDAPNIRAAIDQRLADVLQSISAMVAGISIAFYYGANMAPIGVATAVFLILAQTLVAQYLKFRGHKDTAEAEEPSRLATEAIENHKTVQYLTREHKFFDDFTNQMKSPHRRAIVRGIIQSFAFALSVSFIFFNFGCAYRFGVWLVSKRYSTPYTVFQVIEALNCASMSLLAFATYFPEYVRARLSAGLIFAMLKEQPKIDSLSKGGKQIKVSGDIRLDDLHFSYPTRPKQKIINGVTLDIPKGKTVALVGPSGCGKSTTIQLIERLYDPLHGSMRIDGEDIRQLNLPHLRSQVALVGQEPILFNYSIRDNIAYGLENVTDQQIMNAAKLANAHKFISEMPEGYRTPVGEKGGQLSGGQKQRIAIARAIIRNPKILLLDEATSALDTESEKLVQEALERASTGRTCVVIAHRLSSIQNSDLIIVMKDGQVVEKGNHQQLLALGGLYASLISKQNLN